MKLHAAFPSITNKLWVKKTSCFWQNRFGSFKPETACDGCRMVDLQQMRNPSILSSREKAIGIPENEAAIVRDINDHVTAGYERKIYISKGAEDRWFWCQNHILWTCCDSAFKKQPKKTDEIMVDSVSIVYVASVPAETKQGKKLEKFVPENVMKKFLHGRIKTDAFSFFFTELDIKCVFLLFVKRLPV